MHHRLKALTLLFATVAFLHPSAAKLPDARRIAATPPNFQGVSWTRKPSRTYSDLSMRGGGFSLLGWTVPASHLAKLYIGFTCLNGAVMAVVPTFAASSYGSAFDDSKESLLATLLLERQGDAVLGTGLLLHLSTFTDMPFAQSVAWSTVPYVLSIMKGLATGQLTSLGFNPLVGIAMLLSILLPTLSIAIPNGWNPKVATSSLATIFILIGASGSLDPARSASVEGLDMAGGPGEYHLGFKKTNCFRVSHLGKLLVVMSLAWIQACWSLASLCILQHGILIWRMFFSDVNDETAFGTVGFAALLNAVVAAYVAFASNIPQAVEIPRIGFVVWMIIGLVVGLGIGNY